MTKSLSLNELLNALQEACQSQEWEKAARLDEQIKLKLSQFLEFAKTDQQKQQLAAWLKNVQRIYDLIITDSEKHRDEIGAELKKLSRDKKALNSYLDSASY